MKTINKIQLAGAAALLLCILPMPYGFYTIIRVVITVLSCYLAYQYYSFNKGSLALTFGIIALLFQPFVKLTLGRELWLIVDIVVAALLLILSFKDKFSVNKKK